MIKEANGIFGASDQDVAFLRPRRYVLCAADRVAIQRCRTPIIIRPAGNALN